MDRQGTTARSLIVLSLLAAFVAAGCIGPGEGQESTGCIEGDVTTEVQEQGILISWPEQDSVIVHDIFRKTADDGGFVHVGQAPNFESGFFDDTVDRGTTYTYRVDVRFDTTGPGTGTGTASFCEEPAATAIPFFPTLLAALLGVVGAVGVYTWARRR